LSTSSGIVTAQSECLQKDAQQNFSVWVRRLSLFSGAPQRVDLPLGVDRDRLPGAHFDDLIVVPRGDGIDDRRDRHDVGGRSVGGFDVRERGHERKQRRGC
tara:strand:- start:11805 stop:12107 length:303 start_codon:yes stop_codon:yes gene_type:complete